MSTQNLVYDTTLKTYDPAFAWVKEDWVDFVLSKINPTFTLKRVVAKVLSVEALEDNMIKLVLAPNSKFKGYKAGQFVLLSVTVKSAIQQRAYSIVSFENGVLTLGIKKQGVVSNRIANGLSVGDVVEISQAQGEFVLNTKQTQPCLLIASGSGITPIMAMATQAAKQGLDTTLIYYARQHVFTQEIKALEAVHPTFKAILVDTSVAHEHFSEKQLNQYCPDFADRQVYVCGAPSLMQATKTYWGGIDKSENLHQEHFVMNAVAEGSVDMPVTFRRTSQTIQSKGSLLVNAEAAGLKPAFGCRMGICNTCVCTKSSGVVRNQLTGELNHQPNTQIKLCISEAVTPVTLDL